MKCQKRGGTGEMQICEMGFIGKDECDKCHGKGYLNNEEYLRSLNTEQFAEFVVKAMILYDNSEMTVLEAIKNAMKNDVKLSNYFMESLLEWLKQPHG